jgi:hypothetical protein
LHPEPAEPAVGLEALVQACEQLGVAPEARTGHKAVQHVREFLSGPHHHRRAATLRILKRSSDE